MRHLSFKSRKAGRKTKAGLHIRLGRMLRRRRVAFARLDAEQSLRAAQRHIEHFHRLAQRYDVPVDQTEPLPSLPLLPGQDWIECRQAMGKLAPAIVATPPQPEPATA